MDDYEIYETLTSIFREVFEEDVIELHPHTTAQDVPGWDSLTHVRLMLTIERRFGKTFPASRVANLKNVGELVTLIGTP
jgi:acyl carrier protein